MRHSLIVVFTLLAGVLVYLLLVAGSGGATPVRQDDLLLRAYLPLIHRDPTPTPTNTPIPVTTATPTSTPQPTPAITGDIKIINIFYNGAGSQEPNEHVDIRNNDTRSIQVNKWTLRDKANHVFTFPSHVMQPGDVCRVYTNENHPEWCGFNYGSGTAIWNNGGDTAYLQDSEGTLIDTYSY